VQNNASEYFMFCDQDDVWDSNKIEKTLAKMHDIEKSLPDSPILVNTDLKVVDEELKVLDNSMWNYQHTNPQLNSFNRLLIQNTITGCTMMINKKLAQISLQIPDEALMHDWWIALVASKFGRIEYIHDSTIQYRQHSGNNVGAKRFSYVNIIKNILKKRFSVFFNGNLHKKHLEKHLAKNIEQARAFLSIYKENLGEVDIQVLEDLATIESKSFWQKRKILLRHKLLKQGLIHNIVLFLRI
jgi:GT2 family glycosyltransferase